MPGASTYAHTVGFLALGLVVMERRKVTFKLYPNAREAERLTSWIRLHCELYNAALEERIDAYRKAGKSISGGRVNSSGAALALISFVCARKRSRLKPTFSLCQTRRRT
ncbi:hypothetical protein EOS_40745 [Caballeronia mineralivorans PML1(12)]|uniref:Transposase putative helix-turn-helix domain-containing protein n=1 Tax=Caballeronia mineralivorans PML1(12) TaxID=908627 RepID=A0A0J1CJH5_9BURK|nr:hypothetical protein EOS_40745 [Caballeronia mineralivorans PML1(12)]